MGFFSALAWKYIRGLSLYGLFFIPFAAFLCFMGTKQFLPKSKFLIHSGVMIIALGLVWVGLTSRTHYFSPYKYLRSSLGKSIDQQSSIWFFYAIKNIGKLPGLSPYIQESALFFRHNNIEGPIFNNYDIGGYLIFNLFPQLIICVNT